MVALSQRVAYLVPISLYPRTFEEAPGRAWKAEPPPNEQLHRTPKVVEVRPMPKVCAFHGIDISIYYDDHPEPHFHVRYAGQRAKFGIYPMGLLVGTLPPGVIKQVLDWAQARQPELMDSWTRAEQRLPIGRIQPLNS